MKIKRIIKKVLRDCGFEIVKNETFRELVDSLKMHLHTNCS